MTLGWLLVEYLGMVDIRVKELVMLIPVLVFVVGFAAMLSGLWEQQLISIVSGLVLQIVGAVLFYLAWQKTAKKGNINKDEN
jgi:protein-S-isoprenylcysteine O-methyltransferase Ste14